MGGGRLCFEGRQFGVKFYDWNASRFMVRPTIEGASTAVEFRVIAITAENLEVRWESVIAHPSPQIRATSSQVVFLAVCSTVAVDMVECQKTDVGDVAPWALATRFTAAVMTENEQFQSVVDCLGLRTSLRHEPIVLD